MNRYLIAAALTIAACAAEPPTSATIEALCQRDPVTGRCKTTRDPNDAQSVTLGWITDNYPNSTVDNIFDCGRFYQPSTGRGGSECATGFTLFGTRYIVGCSLYDDGELDCSVEEGED